MHTRASVTELLKKSDWAVCAGLVRIWERQTADEQAAGATKHDNGMGFNGRDAEFGSSLAEQYMRSGSLSGKQIEAGRRVVTTYVGQLVEVSNAQLEMGTEVDPWLVEEVRIVVVLGKNGQVSQVLVDGVADLARVVLFDSGAVKGQDFTTREGAPFVASVDTRYGVADTEAVDFYLSQIEGK